MKYAEGPNLVGRKVLLVEDVVSSGGAIRDAAEALQSDDVIADRAICVIDRQTGGSEALQTAGITLRSLFTMEDIEGTA